MDDGRRAAAVCSLVEQHYDLLYRFAYRLSGSAADAEDLTQQAFLTAQAKLEQLREPDKARAWLLTVVRNAFFKQRRRDKGLTVSPLDAVPEPSVEEYATPLDDVDAVQNVLQELPEEFRIPLVLFYFQELSYKQIAELLDVPIGTVMSRLSRGKAHLRKRLAPEEVGTERSMR
jgi:RNA polymerase sigma-70 factor (ECF subfamily)